jgi:hypothetical protein
MYPQSIPSPHVMTNAAGFSLDPEQRIMYESIYHVSKKVRTDGRLSVMLNSLKVMIFFWCSKIPKICSFTWRSSTASGSVNSPDPEKASFGKRLVKSQLLHMTNQRICF